MKIRKLTQSKLLEFKAHLIAEERSRATIEKYERDVSAFFRFLPSSALVSKENVLEYKQHLAAHYTVASTNSMLAAVNGLLRFLGWNDYCVKLLKVQRQFCSNEKELTKEEYYRLLKIARGQKNERIGLVMQTICSTGIRVSELKFFTIEAAQNGRVEVKCKGKERFVMLSKELQKLLQQYCRRKKIQKGCIFRTRSGMPMNRSNIWSEMKKLCAGADVSPKKVFPHNLRHLFAITFYRIEKDIVHLADILGHSSVETTRIYTTTSGDEHRKVLSQMGLVDRRALMT